MVRFCASQKKAIFLHKVLVLRWFSKILYMNGMPIYWGQIFQIIWFLFPVVCTKYAFLFWEARYQIDKSWILLIIEIKLFIRRQSTFFILFNIILIFSNVNFKFREAFSVWWHEFSCEKFFYNAIQNFLYIWKSSTTNPYILL